MPRRTVLGRTIGDVIVLRVGGAVNVRRDRDTYVLSARACPRRVYTLRLSPADSGQVVHTLASVVVKTSCNETKTKANTSSLETQDQYQDQQMRHETSMHC